MATYMVYVTSVQTKVPVEADYFVIEDGHLIFRVKVVWTPPPGNYISIRPEVDLKTLRAFAPGHWTSVELIEPPSPT